MTRHGWFNRDFLTAIGLIVFAAIVYVQTRHFGSLSLADSVRSPAFFPQIACVAIAVLGVVMLIASQIEPRASRAEAERPRTLALIPIIIATIAYVVLTGMIGFWGATLAYLLATFSFMSGIGWKSGLTALIGSSALYLVFGVLFNVPLP